jgi:hypothetical protein
MVPDILAAWFMLKLSGSIMTPSLTVRKVFR